MQRVTGSYLGSSLLIINVVGLGSLYYLDDPEHIVVSAFTFQIIGGFGRGMASTCNMAILSNYKKDR